MKKKISLFLWGGFFVFIFWLFWWWQNFLLPYDHNNKKEKIFVIKRGETVDSIARNLYKEKLIKNPFGFKVLVLYLGIAKKIQAGDFRLSQAMSAEEIAKELTHGTLDVWVTIPEGLRKEEIALILKSKIGIKVDDFIDKAQEEEGFLFPDTYLIPRNADSKMIINIMTKNFQKRTKNFFDTEKLKREDLKINGLSLKELITLASIIEREAKYKEDQKLVSSILYNRLEIGMKLDVDATVQYALADKKCVQKREKCNYWPSNLTEEDLKIDSPYNTYLYNGLPPAPICNPGVSAILASLSPKKTDFLFYISDKNGKIHPARNFQEHQENIRRYL